MRPGGRTIPLSTPSATAATSARSWRNGKRRGPEAAGAITAFLRRAPATTETFFVHLFAAAGALVPDDQGPGMILNDDP